MSQEIATNLRPIADPLHAQSFIARRISVYDVGIPSNCCLAAPGPLQAAG